MLRARKAAQSSVRAPYGTRHFHHSYGYTCHRELADIQSGPLPTGALALALLASATAADLHHCAPTSDHLLGQWLRDATDGPDGYTRWNKSGTPAVSTRR